jgi:hypothetical protein
MAEIFISFIHEEEVVAKAVYEFIKSLQPTPNVFMSSDRWKIFAGELWLERISSELKEAKVIVLLLSEQSVQRPWVNFEAGGAWFSDKKIIPVCFGGLTKGTLPKPYSSIQALDIGNRDDQYYLIASICHHLQVLTPPHPSVILWDGSGGKKTPYRELTEEVEQFERLRAGKA